MSSSSQDVWSLPRRAGTCVRVDARYWPAGRAHPVLECAISWKRHLPSPWVAGHTGQKARAGALLGAPSPASTSVAGASGQGRRQGRSPPTGAWSRSWISHLPDAHAKSAQGHVRLAAGGLGSPVAFDLAVTGPQPQENFGEAARRNLAAAAAYAEVKRRPRQLFRRQAPAWYENLSSTQSRLGHQPS